MGLNFNHFLCREGEGRGIKNLLEEKLEVRSRFENLQLLEGQKDVQEIEGQGLSH